MMEAILIIVGIVVFALWMIYVIAKDSRPVNRHYTPYGDEHDSLREELYRRRYK